MEKLSASIDRMYQKSEEYKANPHITTAKQYYGMMVMSDLKLDKKYTGRVIKACDGLLKHQVDKAIAACKKFDKFENDEHKFRYFLKASR